MDSRETPTEARTKFGGVTPILRVSNVQASVDYYTRVLNFKIDFFEIIASVSRDQCSLFLVQGDQGHAGGWVWIGVNDVDAVHEEFRQRGPIIRQPPTNLLWACEMQVMDPDGNVLRIGSDPKPNQAFGRKGDRGTCTLTATGRPVGVDYETRDFFTVCTNSRVRISREPSPVSNVADERRAHRVGEEGQ